MKTCRHPWRAGSCSGCPFRPPARTAPAQRPRRPERPAAPAPVWMPPPVQPQRPQPPYVAEVIVAGSSSDVYPLGRHRDLPAAQQACQGDWRVYQPLAWRQTGPAKWSARPGEHSNTTYVIRKD